MTTVLPSDPAVLAAGSAFVGAFLGFLHGARSSRADPGLPEVPRQALAEDDDRR